MVDHFTLNTAGPVKYVKGSLATTTKARKCFPGNVKMTQTYYWVWKPTSPHWNYLHPTGLNIGHGNRSERALLCVTTPQRSQKQEEHIRRYTQTSDWVSLVLPINGDHSEGTMKQLQAFKGFDILHRRRLGRGYATGEAGRTKAWEWRYLEWNQAEEGDQGIFSDHKNFCIQYQSQILTAHVYNNGTFYSILRSTWYSRFRLGLKSPAFTTNKVRTSENWFVGHIEWGQGSRAAYLKYNTAPTELYIIQQSHRLWPLSSY